MFNNFLSKFAGRKHVLFYRDFHGYSGGHQKVFDYFNHCQLSQHVQPSIAFSSDSFFSEVNPWRGVKAVDFAPRHYDLLFLAGLDWRAYLAAGLLPDKPVISLIQHVRHADPASDVFPFLSEKAIRICVSSQVAEAINATGRVNGPVVTIPNGHHIDCVPAPRVRDVYILGCKQPDLAAVLSERLASRGLNVHYSTEQLPVQEVWALMASSRVSVVLPNPTEGFYLPALEAMALSDMTVVPDCVGNRSFCHDQHNCLMPSLELESLLAHTLRALEVCDDGALLSVFRQAAKQTVEGHSLLKERQAFYKILNNIDQLW